MSRVRSSKSHAHARSMRLKLGVLRTLFAIGGRVAPRRTMQRAAALFATPLSSSRTRAAAARGDADMRQDTLQVDGQSIAMYVWGEPTTQPYALLVHGWSSFGLRFLPYVGRLRALGYAVVCFDQPGHGLSSGKQCTLPDFIRTIGAIGQHYGNAAVAVAHSMGGAALVLAQTPQWRAERMVLIAPAADMEAATSRFFQMVKLGAHLFEPFLSGWERRTGVHIRQLQVHLRLPALGQPGLIVHDLDDAEVPWAEGERYARYWQGSHLLTTEGLGHHRVLDAPAVVEAALDFIAGKTVGQRVVGTPNLPFGVL